MAETVEKIIDIIPDVAKAVLHIVVYGTLVVFMLSVFSQAFTGMQAMMPVLSAIVQVMLTATIVILFVIIVRTLVKKLI